MSRVLHGSISSRMPACFSCPAANLRLPTRAPVDLVQRHPLRRETDEAVHLLAAKRGGILDRLAHSVLELADALRQHGDAALSRSPVACRQVVKHVNELMPFKRFDELPLRIRIRKQVLDALEASARGGSKPIQKIDLVEEHREIGRELWHGETPLHLGMQIMID